MATSITLVKGDLTITVEVPHENLDYIEFMSMLEVFMESSPYSQHELESYILDWAEEIRQKNAN